MPQVLENLSWMSFNVFLALLPVLFVYLFQTTKNQLLKIILGSLWIVFLPNTIYLLLDLIHLPYDLTHTVALERAVLVVMYIILVVLGLITYYFAFSPLEALFPRSLSKKRNIRFGLLVLCNLIVGFALVLGRVERVNSWDIIADPMFVISSSLHIITSYHLIILGLLFSLMSTISYLCVKEFLFQPVQNTSKKIKKHGK